MLRAIKKSSQSLENERNCMASVMDSPKRVVCVMGLGLALDV